MSIKPEYVRKIFAGGKRYEYRKSIFDKSVTTVIVYASKPVQRIVGEFEVENVLCDSPEKIWQMTSEQSGISKEFFSAYFKGKAKAYAIKIGGCIEYPESIDPDEEFAYITPPQSFCYLYDDDL